MTCRSTAAGSALTSYARLVSGLQDVQVLSLFHALRAEAPADTPPPSPERYAWFLYATRTGRVDAPGAPVLTRSVRDSLRQRLTAAEHTTPDGPTFYALQNIEERAVRAHAALRAHFAYLAGLHGTSETRVAEAFTRAFTAHRAVPARHAPAAPHPLPFDPAGVPGDRSTRYAMNLLYQVGPHVVLDGPVGVRGTSTGEPRQGRGGEGAQRCPSCGQFAGSGHTCPPAVPAPVAELRAHLHRDYQDALLAQERAHRARAEATAGPSYTADMAAFQAAWDAAQARLSDGDHRLPYLTEDATGGLGARHGGRPFGVEIEVDFPDDPTWTARQRVAEDLHAAGLSQSRQVHGWHYAGRVVDSRGRPMGGGYSDAPDRWSVEFDRSVDDCGGRRGCEIVSPIMYDEPQTWENLRRVCEIVERHGGRVTRRTGLHVNVGAGDFDHTVENHNRLLRLAEAYEDVLVRCAHNPAAGPRHRGRDYCRPSVVPTAGYQSIRDAQVSNGHRAMVNLDHLPAEGAPVTATSRVEVRLFDGTVDPGRVQTNIKVALGLVAAAGRGVTPPGEVEPAGTHRARAGQRRLGGEAWRTDTASFRQLADILFTRAQDKAQLVAAFAATSWQRG